MENMPAIAKAYYDLADMLMREAEYACTKNDPDKVHYCVTEARKLSRMPYVLDRRFG